MAGRLDQGLRKDAAENRERLLAAASDLFAEHGLGVTLNDIAHRAGVGVGTAYRHFPNKEALIDELFEERLQAVVDVAQHALDDSDAWNGLLTFLERALYMRHGDRGLDEIMNNGVLGDERVSQVRDRIAPIITKLVTKAKDQGVVRPDFDQSDLIFIQLALSAITEATRDVSPDLYRRYLTLFLDGIRTDREVFTRLPVKPLTPDETHAAMTRPRRSDLRDVS
ncbi:helix-turn-helix domain-containing protein [Micromonospora sp. NPDC005171]|uniref:TetR/AcrR family transcriptional regulator n=1 Tax=Micromonospora sp. NPDC005171 TaxID=3156866 RepID=UPI0033A52FEE